MRMASDLPPRRPRREPGSGRGRVVVISIAAVVVVLFLSARTIAGFYTDYLWFDSLGFSGVFTGVLGAKLALAGIFIGAFFVVCLANLWIADRLAPRGRVPGPDEEFLRRYQDLVGSRIWLVRIAVSLLFALIAGAGVSGRWKDWLLFTHAQDFGVDDPQFGIDLGFYMFRLPFLSFVVSWLFAAVVIIFVVTAVAHYLNGGIRVPVVGGRATPQVKAHLSVLLGLLALVRAAGYWLDRYELNMSSRGAVDGAGYTDVKAQLPALNLLVLISLAAFVLLIVNIWRRGFTLPVLAVGLWALVAVVAGTAYPALVERFQVEPAGATKELPYIERNIEFTRLGLGLNVETLPVVTSDAVTADEPASAAEANDVGAVARALDPTTDGLIEAFRLSGTGQFLAVNNLDLDSYEIDGDVTPVVITVRELNPGGISRRTWVNEHLAYTHGEGVVIARADRVADDVGRPIFVEPGTNGVPELTRPEIYVSEDLDGYAVVGTTAELSPRSDVEEKSPYEGDGGVQLNSRVRRAAFALRFNEWNLFGSNRIEDDSRLVFHRRVSDRVREVAPFLAFDANPYPVISEGRVKWVVDAYTTSSNQPYGERLSTSELPAGSGLRGVSFNYVRNSAKAVVDAYDGSVVLYVTDDKDPLLKAWRSAFGELFADVSAAPADLRGHFRYPADLFEIQSTAWGRYQLDNPSTFYEQSLGWKVAPAPRAGNEPATSTATPTSLAANSQRPAADLNPMNPQQSVLVTGENDRSLVQLRSYVRFTNDRKLTGFISGVVDDMGRGQLQVQLVAPDTADAPQVASNSAETDEELSEFTTNNSLGDAQLRRGEVQLIPYRDTVLWVRNYFVQGLNGGVPQLKKVSVVFNERVFVGDTLSEALSAALAADVADDAPDEPSVDDPVQPDDPATTPGDDATTAELLSEADRLYAQANDALTEGDLATYQARIEAAFDLVRRAAERAGAELDAEAPPTTEPQQTTTTLSA